jgi:hypothetical protein
MPWTTPETFTAGQTLTAASMNALSGNDGFLYKPPAARIRMKSGQTITFTSGAYQNLSTDATNGFTTGNSQEDFDTDGMVSLSASPGSGSITINTAGIYIVTATSTTNVDTSRFWTRIVRDRSGTVLYVAAHLNAAVSGSEDSQTVTGIIDCNVGDKLQMILRQEDGTNRLIYGDAGFSAIFGTSFSAVWLGSTT